LLFLEMHEREPQKSTAMANRLDYDAARPLSFMFAMASRSAYGPFLKGCNAIDPSSPKRRAQRGGQTRTAAVPERAAAFGLQ